MQDREILWVDRPKKGKKWGGLKRLKEYKRKGVKAYFLNSMGEDHFPVTEAREFGAVVKSLRGIDYCSKTAAQKGFNLLNLLNEKVHGEFISEYDQKELLIIGSDGNFGQEVMKLASGYGMSILDYDVKNDRCTEERLMEWITRAEIIFFCCDANPSSQDYFKAKHYSAMEHTPLIVNPVGRLKLLNIARLNHFLNTGIVGGYACDEIPKNTIKNHEKCVFTDHNCWKSEEALRRREKAQLGIWNELLALRV